MAVVYYKVFYPNPSDPDFIQKVMNKHNIDWDKAIGVARNEAAQKLVELRAFLREYRKGGIGAIGSSGAENETDGRVGIGGLLVCDVSAEYFSFVPGGTQLSSRILGEPQVEQRISDFEGELTKRGFRFKQFDLLDRLKDV